MGDQGDDAHAARRIGRLVAALALLCTLLAPASAAARDVRVFTVSPKFGLDWVDTREHFHDKLFALADEQRRGPASPIQEGLGDVRSRLLGPEDPRRPAATARDLVTLPEDLGLMAAFSGSRATQARAAGSLTEAIVGLIGSYGSVSTYYGQKYPELPARPFPPTRLLAVSLTDTFVRVGVESFAELADATDSYVVAGVTLAQDWQVVCSSRASYVPPPGAGPCAVEDPARVALLRSPDEPERTYAYEATTSKPSTMALVFDPDGKLIDKTVKAFLTPVELPGQLDLVPGEVDGVRAIATPVGRLGIVTSKDAWMPDITRKLDQQRVEVLIQPEFFVGSTVSQKGPWNPDTLQGSGPSDVLRHPSMKAMALPQLVGNVFDFSADAQALIATRSAPAGAFVGQPPGAGFTTVAPWVVPEPGGSFPERRRALGAAGEALLPGGPACASPRRPGPCAGGQVESVLARDVEVGTEPAYKRTRTRRTPKSARFAAARPLRPGRAAQRNVALASRGKRVWAAWEERRTPDGAAGTPIGTGGAADVVFVAASADGGRHFAKPVALGPGWWPSVSVGPDGRVWVAWEHADRVRVASSADGGRSFSAPVGVDGRASQHKPAVAATGAGSAFVAWIDERSSSPSDTLPQAGLYGARLHAGAEPEAARRLDSTGPTAQFAEELDHSWAPALATRGAKLALSWVDFKGYDWSVFTRESDDGGARFGPERRVNAQAPGVEALDDAPAVALTAAGRGLVAFTDWVNPADSNAEPSGLYDTQLARTDTVGAPMGTGGPRQVDGDARAHRSTFSPALVSVGEDALVAWQDSGAGPGVVELARVTPGATGRPLRVAPGGRGQYRPALVVGGASTVVAWEDHRNGPSRIYVTRGATRRLR